MENSRQYLILRTDILQKTVVVCPCEIKYKVKTMYKLDRTLEDML